MTALLTTPLVFAQEQAGPATPLQAQKAVIDGVTGRLRAAEPGEWAEHAAAAQRSAASRASGGAAAGLESHSAVKRLTGAPLSVRLGAVGKRVDMSKMSFSVARIDASGAFSTQCVTGDDAATTALHAQPLGERNDQ